MITLYNILGIEEASTPEQIKDAYRVMAMKWHPDRNPNNRLESEARFKEIGAAYKILSDAEQRRDYDLWLSNQRQNSSQGNYANASKVSDDDAEKIFFESMLDVALDLARRGYDVSAITKALIALDCPETVAKVAALSAIKFGKNKSYSTQNSEPIDADIKPESIRYAGFWRRLAAMGLDGIVLGIPMLLFQFISTGKIIADINEPAYLKWMLFGVIAYWIYDAGFISSTGSTLGRRLVGIEVARAGDGRRLSFTRASVRFFSRYISFITLYIGFLMQPFTRKKQTIHDMISDSVVVTVADKGKALVFIFAILPMILVFVGIVAAISLPVYKTYTTKMHVAKGLQLGNSAASSIETYYLSTRKIPASLADAGVTQPLDKDAPQLILDQESGTIYVHFINKNIATLSDTYLIITPYQNTDQNINWECTSYQIAQNYLPASCKFVKDKEVPPAASGANE